MPSIEAVEQFKTIVQGLAREPEIRAQMGLAAEQILPPESQLDDDLADLLGGMPGGSPEESPSVGSEDEPLSEADEEFGAASDTVLDVDTSLDDLFAAPLPSDDIGPSLDDLLGPAPGIDSLEPQEPEVSVDEFSDLDDFAAQDLTADELAAPDELASEDFAPADFAAPDDFGTTDLAPMDLGDDFFQEPAAAEAPPSEGGGDDFEFDDAMGDADFPELAGFADTNEADVEAFDVLKEADEFQLGDFESQFGITADDHTDAELLNPAQSVDLEVEAAQRELSLTESEFAVVQKALGQLPLNLRLAVEELIGEKEVVFEDLDRIVRLLVSRAPVRTLAAAVGKILGRKIIIPAGFEKGSGADIEARQSTIWYNLRTIMLPVLRVAAIASVVAAVLVLLGWNFLLRPWKANDLYDRGLVAARQNDGALADDLFAQARYYWPVQDRFFQYAEAYQDSGDYDRARRKYLELMQPSVRPYLDEDKPKLAERLGKPLAPLPDGLEGKALADRLNAKKAALDAYYAYVTALLSTENAGADVRDEIPGEVILGNPDTKAILDYSRFETNFGFDGRDLAAHFRRADAILRPLLAKEPGSKDGLLRQADNFLAWTQALSTKASLDKANSALSEYLRLYGYDSPVTWRFVRVFLLEDEESELLRMRDRIDADKKMAMDGETMAQLARWLIDREEATVEKEKQVPLVQKTVEQEYGVRPKLVEPPEALTAKELAAIAAARKEQRAKLDEKAATEGGKTAPGGHSLLRAEEAAAPEGEKKIVLTPPFKYPNSSQPYRAAYLDKVDTLLLRSMDTQKSLPELHFELSRFYRHNKNKEDERRALGAADTYFQRLQPRMARLNGRPALRVATSNRIGEIFDEMGQPLQAEKYYLDAQKNFEAFRTQGLVSLDAEAAKVYRNLGNLYYRQTPGVEADGQGTVPGGWEQALKLFETAELGHGEVPDVSYRLGVIEYEKQDFGQAVRRFFTLDRPGNLGESSGRQNPNLLYAMGNALFRSGNYASAEGYYRELLALLRDKRARITDWDPVARSAHKALAQRLYETWNNLAAAEYRASNKFRSGTPEFRESLAALTTARAQAQILGRDLYEDKTELDVTAVDATKLQSIRDDEAQIVAKTRKEKGLVEANLQVLSLLETAPPSRKEALAKQLEIFARIPLELDQAQAP